MDTTDSTDAMLNRALKLAYFIHNDKATALRIVAAAMMRLETTAAAQDKRFYYTPIGRLLSDRLKSHGFRNKINLNNLDLLQLLVFIESEPYEKLKEMGQCERQVGEEDMIIHFIKHLVTITMKRNSFYVALGMCRLLHNYSTSETMDIYSVILQDPDRTKDDHYCRARKGRLMQEMKQRFGALISAGRGPHGEERFRSLDRPARYAGLVRECLELFSPWRALCPVPAGFNPTRDLLSSLSSTGRPVDEDHQTEVNRIHAIVHPDCFTRLTEALAFDCPEERLALPRFFTSHNSHGGHNPPSDRRRPPALEWNDRALIQGYLDEQTARRRAVTGRMFSVRVDAVERANLNLDLSNMVRVEVDKSSTMIEVVGFDGGGEVLLATHLLHLQRSRRGHRSAYSIKLDGGRELSFQPGPLGDSDGEGRCVIEIRCRENASRTLLTHQWRGIGRFLTSALVPARRPARIIVTVGTALVLVIALAYAVLLHKRFIVPPSPAAVGTSNDSSERSLPDESSPRETTAVRENGEDKSNSQHKTRRARRPRSAELASGRKGIARRDSIGSIPADGATSTQPLIDKPSGSDATRDPEVASVSVPLLKVRGVYIECHGGEGVEKEFREAFTNGIEGSRRFQIADSARADAALKVFETGIDRPGAQSHRGQRSANLGIRVQLVNRGGEVLWETAKRFKQGGSSRSARQVASEILNDLLHHIRELEELHK